MRKLNKPFKASRLQISFDKTMVMYQLAPTNLYYEPEIFLDNIELHIVEKPM